MSKPILNIDELQMTHSRPPEGTPGVSPDQYEAYIAVIGSRLGARKLGYNLTVLPPGKRAFPLHSHAVNEEMFFILEGSGELRVGEERFPVRRGDVIACPPGGPESAHQLINTAAVGDLKYLAVSTMSMPEISEFPDLGTFAVATELPPDSAGAPRYRHYSGKMPPI